LFSNGNYFEWIRNPLTAALIGIFSIFTWKLAPYFYIIFVSFLHFYSSLKIAERFDLNKTIYYLLSLSPFLLLEGLKNSTELLTLSLVQLFLANFNNLYAGIFFGLAFLSRYTSIGLIPLILFLKKPKKIVIFALIFLLIISPWLIFNYIKTGNALTSIADSYALNVLFRDYINDKFPVREFLMNFSYLLILSFIGLAKKIKNLNKNDFLMLLLLILVLISFYKTPVKSYTLRYVFLILIPLTYFSTIVLQKIKKKLIYLIFAISLITSFFITAYSYSDNLKNYEQALPYLENCSTYSNNWIYLDYLGKNTRSDLYKEQFKSKIEKGDRILMYYNDLENPYIKNESFIKNLQIITRNDKFILFGNESKCNADEEKIDRPYLINRRNTLLEVYNYTEDISNCSIFFKRKLPLIC